MAPSRRLTPVVAVVAALLTACAGGPGTVDPSGVDGLEIPTPTPDPADFVEGIDNPHLPLRPGNEWVYESTGVPTRTVTVSVADDTREVAGVSATVVEEVVTNAGGRVVGDSSRWFAQDRDGNVWSLGDTAVTESWEAGVDGAQAGLAMPATPRLGDGYRQQFAAGVAEDQAEVVALDEALQLNVGDFEDLLVVEHTTPLAPGEVERRYYAPGTGLVFVETDGRDYQLELISFTTA